MPGYDSRDHPIMHESRTPVDWLIAIVNILALLLGLGIGWLWIFDAAGHYMANDNHPNIRIGMSLGFAMAYLVWTSVVTTYIVLKRRPTAEAEMEPDEGARRRVRVVRIRRRVSVPTEESDSNPPPIRVKAVDAAPPESVTEEAYKASPPPIRVKTASAAPEATPVLEPDGNVYTVQSDGAETAAPLPSTAEKQTANLDRTDPAPDGAHD
jgi:hypothetical protein